jgi:hypothetical protein
MAYPLRFCFVQRVGNSLLRSSQPPQGCGVQRWRPSALDDEPEHERYLREEGGVGKEEERFLSTQADRFAGVNREEKASGCFARNDGWGKEERIHGIQQFLREIRAVRS